MDWQSIDLFGVRVAKINRTELVAQVLAWVKDDSRRTVTYVNAHCVNLVAENPIYRQHLNQVDLVYVDGIGVVWAGKVFGFRGLQKITGRNWIDEFCKRGEKQSLRLYLLAGKPGVVEQASSVLMERYPGLIICGLADGYFEKKTEEQVIDEMAANPPQVLLLGMGVPNQERWLVNNRERIPANVCWCVGALFDYIAGVERPVPLWLERCGLEWVWRLKEDPRGKWRRYLIGIPRFVLRVIKIKLRYG